MKITYNLRLLAGLGGIFFLASLFTGYSYWQWQLWQRQNEQVLQQVLPQLPPAPAAVFAAPNPAAVLPDLASKTQVQLLRVEEGAGDTPSCRVEISGTFADTVSFLNACGGVFSQRPVDVQHMQRREDGKVQTEITL